MLAKGGMVDFAKNYTDMISVRYTSNGLPHWMMFRTGVSMDDAYARAQAALAIDGLRGVINAYGPTDFAWLEAKFQAKGTLVSIPVELPDSCTSGSWAGANNPRKLDGANELRFEARSNGGSRYSFSVFGLGIPAGTDDDSPFRVLAGETLSINNAIAALVATTGLTAIDGNLLRWKRYANFGQNAYLKRKIRNG